MIKTKTIKGMKIEFRTNKDASMACDVIVDDVIVGCDASSIKEGKTLFDELIQDKSGSKAKFLKKFILNK